MRSSRSVILLLVEAVAAAILVGCQPPPKPLPPPPPPAVASPEQAVRIQADLNNFGAAHVGRVNTISADDHLAAITGISDKDAKLGDVISILDVSGKVIANGTVTYIHIDKETSAVGIVVKYELSPDGGRVPMKDDLAVTQLPAPAH